MRSVTFIIDEIQDLKGDFEGIGYFVLERIYVSYVLETLLK